MAESGVFVDKLALAMLERAKVDKSLVDTVWAAMLAKYGARLSIRYVPQTACIVFTVQCGELQVTREISALMLGDYSYAYDLVIQNIKMLGEKLQWTLINAGQVYFNVAGVEKKWDEGKR